MEIKKNPEKNKETLSKASPHPLQSHEWAEFRKAWGNEVLETKYGIIILHKIPLTKYKVGMFIKGPVPTAKMLADLRQMAKKNNLLFIKLEPNVAVEFPISKSQIPIKSKITHSNFKIRYSKEKVINLLKENGCVQGKTLFTPTSFWIDLTPSEDELLKNFSSKTRYNIRYAQRKGVEVVEDNSNKAFEKYIELTRETVERQGFYAHTESYHRLMWKYLHPTSPRLRGASQSLASPKLPSEGGPIARLLTAKYNDEIITCWIIFVYKDFLYYPYGASSEKYKNVMANNLMMWEAIRYGKKLGLKTFDLWGREPGKGFTKFKEGYNPQVVEFIGTWDLVTSPLYWPYRTAEFLRWQILRTKSKFVEPKF